MNFCVNSFDKIVLMNESMHTRRHPLKIVLAVLWLIEELFFLAKDVEEQQAYKWNLETAVAVVIFLKNHDKIPKKCFTILLMGRTMQFDLIV